MSSYKPYPTYKDSGIGWIGDIPVNWGIKKTKYLFKIVKRIVGELGHDVLSITQKGIKVKDIESGGGQLAMDYSKYQLVRKGDFAMNHMDLLTGYVDISRFDGVISPDYRVFKLTDNSCDHDFFLYLYQKAYWDKLFYPLGQGSSQLGRWRFPSDEFNLFQWPIPPVQEQTAIAEFLNHKTTEIELLIQKKKDYLRLNIERRKSLTEHIIKSNEVEIKRISTVSELINRPIEYFDDKLYTTIGLYNKGRGIFHKPGKIGRELGDSSFYQILKGDVILSGQFAWEGAVALATREDEGCVASHRYPVLKCNTEEILPEFLFSFFTLPDGHFLLDLNSRGAAGRNRPLNAKSLMKEKIPVPPISAQELILDSIKIEFSVKRMVYKEIALIEEYKRRLISDAITGKIDVRDWTHSKQPKESDLTLNSEPETNYGNLK